MAEVLTRKVLKVEFQETVPGTAAVPLQNSTLAAFDKKVLVIGGVSRGHPTKQCLEFDALTRLFAPARPLPQPRSEAVAFVDAAGAACMVFGGWDGLRVLAAPLLLLPASAAEVGATPWREEAAAAAEAPLPAARRMHCGAVMAAAAASDKSVGYVFGGFDGAALLNDLWEYGFESGRWREVEAAGHVPAPRDNATLVADAPRDQLLLFGGYTTCRCCELFTFARGAAVWTQVSMAQCPTPRFGCFGIACGNYAIFGLGQDAMGASRLICQTTLSGEWKWSVPVMENDADVEPAIHFAWCIAEGGKRVVVFGGTDEAKYHTAMLELDFDKTDPIVPPKGKK